MIGADMQMVRRVLAMPEAVALGYLGAYHAATCKCGQPEDMKPLLNSLREKWAGK
jgi:hypothetical protein